MEPNSNFQNFSIFRWAAIDAVISTDGEFRDQQEQTVKLSILFSTTRKQLFDLARVATPASSEGLIRDLDELIYHTILLKNRYQEKLGTLFSRIFNQDASKTLSQGDKLILEANSVKALLKGLKGSSLDDMKGVFDTLMGKSWEKNIALLEPLPDGSFPLAPLRPHLVSWSTMRSIKWLCLPYSKKTPLDHDQMCHFLPHLDFQAITIPALNGIHQYVLDLNGGTIKKNWPQVRAIYYQLAKAMEARQINHDVQTLMRCFELMKIFDRIISINRTMDALSRGDFPMALLEKYHVEELCLLKDAGVLTGDTALPGYAHENAFFHAMNDPEVAQLAEANSAYKAGVFMLRQHCRKPIQDKDLKYRICRGLTEFPEMEQFTPENQTPLNPKKFYFFYSTFEWLKNADPVSYQEFAILYPSHFARFQEVQNANNHFPSPIHAAIHFVDQLQNVSALTKSRLLAACVLDRNFPVTPNREEWQELNKLDDTAIAFLKNDYPYIHGFIELGKKGLSHGFCFNSKTPVDLYIVLKNFNYLATLTRYSTLSDFILISKMFPRKSMNAPREIHDWLPYTISTDKKIVDLSGGADFDDEVFGELTIPKECRLIDLSDTNISPLMIRHFQEMHPQITIKYRNTLVPGKKLVTCPKDFYPEAFESLVRQIAPYPPQLDRKEEPFFLEYCFTHHIAECPPKILVRLVLKSHEQGWRGIGEYCLAMLISEIKARTLLQTWELSKVDPVLNPLRHHCARFSMAFCQPGGSKERHFKEDQRQKLQEMAKEITHFTDDDFIPPPFQPVDLSAHFPREHILICSDGAEIKVNLVFLSLHSQYFEMMLLSNSSSDRSYESIEPTPHEGREMRVISSNTPDDSLENVKKLPMVSGYYMQMIYTFLCSNELPAVMEKGEMQDLLAIADFLMIPEIVIALRERLKN